MPQGILIGALTPTKFLTGTTALAITSVSGGTGIVLSAATRFQLASVATYFIDLSMRIGGNVGGLPFTLQVFNETLSSVVASQEVTFTGGVPESFTFQLSFPCVNVLHEFSFRLVLPSAGTRNNVTADPPVFTAFVANLVGGGGGGGGDPVVVDLGTLGASFSPSVARATNVIVAEVDAPFTMDNITITDGVVNKEIIRVELTQGAVGGDISAWSAVNFVGSDLVPLTSVGLSVGAGKTDILVFEWDDNRGQWMLVGFFNGIAP